MPRTRSRLLGSGSTAGGPVRNSAGGIPPLDGQVTSSAQISTVVNNTANSGKSYWMRGGNYGSLVLNGTPGPQPTSLITFITYPGEQVTFSIMNFGRTKNMRFDGNSANFVRSSAGGLGRDGQAGLWVKGDGAFATPAGHCLYFDRAGPEWNENLQFANAWVGDAANATYTNWHWNHGITIRTQSRDLLFEDMEIAFMGNDGGLAGDDQSGGFGVWWQYGGGEDALTGNHTFRRIHIHHCLNDAFQTGGSQPPGDPTAKVTVDTALVEHLEPHGDNHCDFIQQQSTQLQLWKDVVFRTGLQFLMTGGNGSTRTFQNCVITGLEQLLNFPGRNDTVPENNYDFVNCTIFHPFRLDSSAGAAASAVNKLRASIHSGFTTIGEVPNNCFSNNSQPNKVMSGGTALTGDVSGTPSFNSSYEPTDGTTQGWRRPVDFPWTL